MGIITTTYPALRDIRKGTFGEGPFLHLRPCRPPPTYAAQGCRKNSAATGLLPDSFRHKIANLASGKSNHPDMLEKLSIENYALIEHLELELSPSLNIITGETGAGKSILLGALGLILGNRSDTGVLKDTSRNCVTEGTFDIEGYGLEPFFDEQTRHRLRTSHSHPPHHHSGRQKPRLHQRHTRTACHPQGTVVTSHRRALPEPERAGRR